MPRAYFPLRIKHYTPVYDPMPPLEIADISEGEQICVQFSRDLVPYLLGLLEIYRWEDNFRGSEEEVLRSLNVIQQLVAVLIEGSNCMDDCCSEEGLVLNATFVVLHQISETGQMQVSTDDGATWVQDPDDPRLQFPVLPALVQPGNGHTKCDAASNAIGDLKDIQARCSELLGTGLSAVVLAIDIIAIIVDVVFFGGAGLPALIGILIGLTKSIADIEKTAYDSMFSEDAWDKTLCAMYCTIGENGKFTETQFQNLMDKLYADLPGRDNPLDVSANMRAFFRTMGVGGLNNICAAGAIYDADCTDCDCNGCILNGWDVKVGTELEELRTDTSITVEAFDRGDGFFVRIAAVNFNNCCCHLEATYTDEGFTPTFIAYNPCGLSNVDDTNIGFSYSGQATNLFEIGGTVAFTATITSTADCDS